MPQMMPLLWAPLFILFTVILLVSFSKIYFSESKSFLNSTLKMKFLNKEENKWLW